MKNLSWKKHRLPALLMVLVLLLGMLMPASAAQTKEEIEKELAKIEQNIKAQEKEIAALKDQKADQEELLPALQKKLEDITAKAALINAEIARLNKSISAIKAKVDKLTADIAACEASIARIDMETAAKDQAIKNLQAQLMNSLRQQYMDGPVSNLQLLLSSTDLADFMTAAEYIDRKAAHDNDLREQLEDEMEQLKQLQEQQRQEQKTLESSRTQLQKESVVLVEESLQQRDALAEVKTQENEITGMQSEIFSVIDKLNKQTKQSQLIIDKERRAREQFERELDALLASKLESGEISKDVANDGKMIWPFPYKGCRISSYYGETSNRSRAHAGIDITHNDKSKTYYIIAALDGVIVDHGFHSSMGNYVVIVHGYYAPTGKYIKTTYMHMKSFSANAVNNAKVKAGTTLGIMGSTGNSTGPHLHFQVNEFTDSSMSSSRSVNPLNGYVTNTYK